MLEPPTRQVWRVASIALRQTATVISFALKTLISDSGKLLIGLAGVVFSVVLISVQGGLYLGLVHKASVLIDHCDADVWIGHHKVENVDLARDIPEIWGNRVRGIPGVESVAPYLVGKGTAALAGGHMEDVWIIGSDPVSLRGTAWSFREGSPEELRRPHAVSFDEVDLAKLGHPHLGDWVEVNGHRTQLVAQTGGITGFITMPYLFTTLATARELSNCSPANCSYLLVKLQPEVDRQRVISAIRSRLPGASVQTPEEFARLSQDYWMKRTGIGISFGASTLLGLLVGIMMVGQSLYALAHDHLEDYATLKAIGATDHQILGVIVLQSQAMAVAGSLMGIAIVEAIRQLWHSPLAPIDVPQQLLAVAVGLVFLICLAAALLPFLQIRRVDPAIVLMG